MSELNLPYIRFVKQVSNGMARTKYSYLAMQTDLLTELKKATWKQATCPSNNVTTVPNKVSQTDGVIDEQGVYTKAPTYTAFINDKYDVYKQGGDANTSTATFCGYAGMVAYRFALPADYSSNITHVKLKFQASRYLRSGLKATAVLTDAAEPSNDWDVIRGNATSTPTQKIVSTASEAAEDVEGVSSWGFMSQNAPTLIDTRASEATLDMDASESRYADLGTSTRFKYLWVYVSIEDYTDYWVWYSANEPRYYSIEGSATLVGAACSVTFAGEVSLPSTLWRHTLNAVENGFYLPLASVSFDASSQLPIYEQQAAEAFGNYLDMCSFEAGIVLDSSPTRINTSTGINVPSTEAGQSYRTRVLEFARCPRKDAFTKFYPDPPNAGDDPDTTANVLDIGTFAINPSKMRLSRQLGGAYFWANEGGNIDDTIQYRMFTKGSGDCIYTDSNGNVVENINKYAMLKLKSTARIVPHGKLEYKKMCVKGSFTGNTVSGVPTVDATINIWKCSSADAIGYWRIQGISTLLSHQELYTVSEKTLNVQLTGTGTWSQQIHIDMTADYVGEMPIPDGTENKIELESAVSPGDVIIFVPNIKQAWKSCDVSNGYISQWGNIINFNYILVA